MPKPIRWTITKKVGGTVFILLSIILALLIHSIFALKEIDTELREVAKIDVPLTQYANEVEIAQLEQRILMDEVLRKRLSGIDSSETDVKEIERWGDYLYQQFDKAIVTAKQGLKVTGSEEFKKLLATLLLLQEKHKEIDLVLIEVLKPNASKETVEQIILMDEAFDRIAIDLIHAIEKLTQRNAQLVLEHEEQFALITYSLGGIGGIVGIALALLIILSIKSSIAKISRNIERVSQAIESNEDIPVDEVEHVKSSDEFRDLSKNLTDMISRVSSDIDKREEVSAKLSDLATKDHLTKCFNRFKWEEVASMEIERSARTGTPLSLIYFDIDHFKKINDSFGHDIGDVTLIKIAEIAKQNSRQIDSVYRLGGEEFAILLPSTDMEEAYTIAERLRIEIDRFEFDSVKHVTVSLGVTQLSNTNDDLTNFVKRADQALYFSKENGRNQVAKQL